LLTGITVDGCGIGESLKSIPSSRRVTPNSRAMPSTTAVDLRCLLRVAAGLLPHGLRLRTLGRDVGLQFAQAGGFGRVLGGELRDAARGTDAQRFNTAHKGGKADLQAVDVVELLGGGLCQWQLKRANARRTPAARTAATGI
jgi:hypothetical protein